MRRVIVPVLLLLLALPAYAQAPQPAQPAAGQKTSGGANAAPAGGKSGPAAKTEAAETEPSEATVESFMKHMFGYDSNLQWRVMSIQPSQAEHVMEVVVGVRNQQNAQEPMQPMFLFVMPDQHWAIAGEMMPFGADPFAPTNELFAAKAHGPARGPGDASTVLVEFSDLECPACKAAEPTIEKLLDDFPSDRFIFQNYPLEQIHPWAFKAAEYAECVAQDNPDAFWKFLQADYQNQESVTKDNVDQKMKDFATQAGAKADKVTACVADPAAEKRVRDSLALGKDVEITGTPTLFVNGRRVANFAALPYETLKLLVAGSPK
jgi:protein-disulfide isomerase